MKELYLIDGYGFVFRAFHSLPPLTRGDGTPIGAVYGFTNMLLKVLSAQKPDYMAVVFDSGKKTFRHDIYPEYKANRPPPPPELLPQFPLVREAAEAVNLPSVELPGYEADDLIATIAREAVEQGVRVTIVSSDKDLMQLVSDNIRMFDPVRGNFITEKEVLEKFSVPPEKVLDVLSLMGDSSDNVPGVPGIGPKTAAELVNQFGSLDAVLENSAKIPQKKRSETLTQNRDKALLSRELIKLDDHAPVKIALEDMAARTPDNEKLSEFLEKQGFKTLLARVDKGAKKEEAKKGCEILAGAGALSGFLAEASGNGALALCFLGDAGIGFSSHGHAAYLPLAAKAEGFDFGGGGGVTMAEALGIMRPVLADISVTKICEGLKELCAATEEVNGAEDVALMSYLAGSEWPEMKLEILTGTGRSKKRLGEVETAAASEFACGRAMMMEDELSPLRRKIFSLHMVSLYQEIEKPLAPIIARMEKAGAKVDRTALARLSGEFGAKIKELEARIHALAGHEFNIGSPQQLGEVLFNEQGLAGGRKGKSGTYSTGADVLEEMAAMGHELPALVLEWRQFSKLKSTYTDALQEQINPKTGRVHTTYSMTATTTGRLSSTEPNLQNIPIRTPEGRKIREAFVAESGNKLISADYSQIELRLLAHMADVKSLKQAFLEGKDIHAITASQVFGVPVESVDSALRRKAKAINFGIIYGISAFGLKEQLGISQKEAADYIAAYFANYPGIKQYMESTKEFCRAHGYTKTIFGRTCFVPGINDKNPAIRSFSERAAINAPLQGSAADIIKRAMVQLGTRHEQIKMLLQVHDELIFEVPESKAREYSAIIKRVMEGAVSVSVPLTVEVSIGDNWGEIH